MDKVTFESNFDVGDDVTVVSTGEVFTVKFVSFSINDLPSYWCHPKGVSLPINQLFAFDELELS